MVSAIAVRKSGKIVFLVFVLIITLVAGFFLARYYLLLYRVLHATQQIETFYDLRSKALQSDTDEGVQCLANVLGLFPSGTMQETGSPLDRMVERARESVAREIVAYLRKKSPEDLGEDPEKWIQALKVHQPR
jgi:hypothetical protein